MQHNPTPRSEVIRRRTYCRELESGQLEQWSQVIDRVISHQQWLWERAQGTPLSPNQVRELSELRELIEGNKIMPAGRTLWLGGTQISKTRESCMFNCSFTHAETVCDIVDILWLLLQGCGVGFKPVVGTLVGLKTPLKSVRVVRSTRTEKGGKEDNEESFFWPTNTWTIKIGDSAAAWAKAVGKLLVARHPAKHLVIDLSEIRPAGDRLRGYGWISSGDEQIAKAFEAIAWILSSRADQLLTRMNILDIVNWLGTILSSRRSAEIALFEYGQPEWEEFALAKKDFWLHGNAHRQQSNNSLLFHNKPSRAELEHIFELMQQAGGSEPGFINAQEAERRAPWFKGCNPCVEILLGNKSFCNLTEVNVLAFKGDKVGLERALFLAGRMNYRQTMVNLRDEILQEAWHLNNDFLHLCGVGLTGIAPVLKSLTDHDLTRMKGAATAGAVGMAYELKSPLPKNVTCIKPSGTISKIMGTEEWGEVTEGVHMPLGRFIFNNVTFSKYDPQVKDLRDAGYEIMAKPFEPESVLVKFPVEYKHVPLYNNERATEQLDRYKRLQRMWCDQNVSCTVSYSPSEVSDIVGWLLDNWDSYVGVSFLYRTDPTKTAKDLGYAYLPQEVVTEEVFNEYVAKLAPIRYLRQGISESGGVACEGGLCNVK